MIPLLDAIFFHFERSHFLLNFPHALHTLFFLTCGGPLEAIRHTFSSRGLLRGSSGPTLLLFHGKHLPCHRVGYPFYMTSSTPAYVRLLFLSLQDVHSRMYRPLDRYTSQVNSFPLHQRFNAGGVFANASLPFLVSRAASRQATALGPSSNLTCTNFFRVIGSFWF